MNNEHDGKKFTVLLGYICTSKDYKYSFNMNYEDYLLKKYVLEAS